MDDDTLVLISNSETTQEGDVTAALTSPLPLETTRAPDSNIAPASSTSLRMRRAAEGKQRIGVIGTGNYAVALVKRLATRTGCDVIIGSRKPELRRRSLSATLDFSGQVDIASIQDCITRSDIVIVAIHWEDFKVTLQDFVHLFTGKIVVDVSNRDTRNVAQSNADYLASILRSTTVVKAFNSVSAYTMEDISDTGESSVVYVAGNDLSAREKVMTLARDMGFRAVNLGLLTSARLMEDNVLSVFSLWRIPLALTACIFTLVSAVIVYHDFIAELKRPDLWEQIFLFLLNKSICLTAITTLALTYLPGQLAAILQVYYGTKHRRFPQFLDTWLKFRKQLGLITFFLVTLHAVMSIIMLSPDYYHSWYHTGTVTIPANTTFSCDIMLTPTRQRMTWRGESACLLGILAFVLMGVVALTSIRSIGDSLNWSEWRYVQSHLGYIVLAFATGHVIIVCYRGWWRRGFPTVLLKLTFWSVLLPIAVLVLKLAFSLPPLSGYLHKIRRGWEREGAKYGNNTGYGGNVQFVNGTGDGCCGRDESVNIEEAKTSGVNIAFTERITSSKNVPESRDDGKRRSIELGQCGPSSTAGTKRC